LSNSKREREMEKKRKKSDNKGIESIGSLYSAQFFLFVTSKKRLIEKNREKCWIDTNNFLTTKKRECEDPRSKKLKNNTHCKRKHNHERGSQVDSLSICFLTNSQESFFFFFIFYL
jgi:hypothetical protein